MGQPARIAIYSDYLTDLNINSAELRESHGLARLDPPYPRANQRTLPRGEQWFLTVVDDATGESALSTGVTPALQQLPLFVNNYPVYMYLSKLFRPYWFNDANNCLYIHDLLDDDVPTVTRIGSWIDKDARLTLPTPLADGTTSVTALHLREGVERFMVTDINNPGASAKAQSEVPVVSTAPRPTTTGESAAPPSRTRRAAPTSCTWTGMPLCKIPGHAGNEFPLSENFVRYVSVNVGTLADRR